MSFARQTVEIDLKGMQTTNGKLDAGLEAVELVSSQLGEARAISGLSRAQLAEMSGDATTESEIARVEKGETTLSIRSAAGVMSAFIELGEKREKSLAELED